MSTPCGDHLAWDFRRCPSHDTRCGGCPQRPESPHPEVELVTGGAWRLTRDTLQALARALRLGRWEPRLSVQQVDKILARWVEFEFWGGGAGPADVAPTSRGAAGWEDWKNTVAALVWADPATHLGEYIRLVNWRGEPTDEWRPAIDLVAHLRWYEEPALRGEAKREAQRERTKIEARPEYRRAMRRLQVELAVRPAEFLRVALGLGSEERR